MGQFCAGTLKLLFKMPAKPTEMSVSLNFLLKFEFYFFETGGHSVLAAKNGVIG